MAIFKNGAIYNNSTDFKLENIYEEYLNEEYGEYETSINHKRQNIQNRATRQLADLTNKLKSSNESYIEETKDENVNKTLVAPPPEAPTGIKINPAIKRTSHPAKNQKQHLKYLKQKQVNKTNGATDQSEMPTPSRLSEEALYNDYYKYPVFITLMHSGTPLANAIKFVTKDEFSHACISFNSKLDPIYSFGSKKLGGIDLGLVSHNQNADFYKKFKAHYRVYVLFVDKKSLKEMKSRLDWFIKNNDKLKYDFKGLFDIWFNKDSEDHEYKYFCSRFVAEILKYSGKELDKLPSLYTPQDLNDLYYISLVNGGEDFSKYNYRNTERSINNIKKGIYDDVMFSEALRFFNNDDIPLYSTISEALSYKQRQGLSDKEFGIPEERKYPLNDKEHVLSAIKLFGHVEPQYEKQLANNIKKAMKKYNIDKSKVGKDNKLYKYINENSIIEDATTANTMVGPMSSPDSVYVVNYLKKNSFSGENESKYAIGLDKSLSNIYCYEDDCVQKKTLEEFKESYEIKGIYYPNYYTDFESIIEEMINHEGMVNNLLNNDKLIKECTINNTYLLNKTTTILDELSVIEECIRSSYEKINEYYLPYINYINEEFKENNNYNYYVDKDGVFIMNENKMLRSKSYKNIRDINEIVFRYISLGHL